ncbi:MAG TPA: rhodanese-related sulfurtransferase [Patescibacteria group bacterium]|nr:rhodanese-related sulfurtransferase [Patescibacteria group bacterium]
MATDSIIILFYKYISIENPEKLKEEQKLLCQKLGLKGRMIIAKEGVNATFEGTSQAIHTYLEDLLSRPGFEDIHIKKSVGTGNAFPRLSIKVREEIVATHLQEKDIDPRKTTGKYLTAQELREWFQSGKEFYIVDMRNDFEQAVGFFKNSLPSGMGFFRDLPKVLKNIEHLKNKTILTVCTGGVRCEKASGFLVENGFSDVYQLFGGIVTYMETYPGEDFLGSLYVFDNRLVMGFNMDDPKRTIVGKCVVCGNPSEHFINCKDGFCHRHFIVCEDCLGGAESILCPMGCRDYSQEHPEAVAAR